MVKVNGWKEMPEAIGGVCAEERQTIIRKDRSDGLEIGRASCRERV